MWIVKNTAPGLTLFVAFFAVYFVTVIAGGVRQHAAIGISAITGGTIYRPPFWAAFLLIMMVPVCARSC
jgi:hypothetical protein